MHGHGQQGNGHLLAGRGDDVEFARIGRWGDLLGQADQAVGFAGHCRRNDDHVVPLSLPAGDAFRDVLDTIRRGNRCATELLNYQRHWKSNLRSKKKRYSKALPAATGKSLGPSRSVRH